VQTTNTPFHYEKVDEQFLKELRHLLADHQITLDQGANFSLSTGPLGSFRAFRSSQFLDIESEIIVRPESTDQVADVVSLAHKWKIPIVPYGSGTGVMGGTSPVYRGILLDLRSLNSVLNVDPISHTVTAQSGLVLEHLQDHLGEYGFMIGHDPWSQPIATLGGAISTNGVGYLAAKYGTMGDQVLGLTVVLANGQVIRDKKTSKDSMGPDTKHLFIGAEGTIGIITEATVRIYPIPEYFELLSFSFQSFAQGYQAILDMQRLTVSPSMLDFTEEMDSNVMPSYHEIYLHLAFEGSPAILETAIDETYRICSKYDGTRLDLVRSREFWDTRHASAEAYKASLNLPVAERRERHSSWRKDYLHVTIPPSLVLAYRAKCEAITDHYGCTVTEWSVWGRPEFFSFIVGEPQPGNKIDGTMDTIIDELLMAALAFGGTIEYCHGVGLKLSHLIHEEQGAKKAVLNLLKHSLDPHNILNPGKLGYFYPGDLYHS